MKSKNLILCRVSAALLCAILITGMLVTTAGAALLRQGSRGEEVKKVQKALLDQGYYSGAVDGIFGPKTEEAVKAFQKKNNLSADGIVGPQTLKAMGLTSADGSSGSSSGSASHSNDLNILARMIAAEGRGEPYLGQVAIGAVIMNRVKHPSFPNTISGVLFQKHAFSAVDDGQFASTPITDSCRRAADEAFNGSDPTGGCIFYYNPDKTTNAFMTSKPISLRIGKHVFCK